MRKNIFIKIASASLYILFFSACGGSSTSPPAPPPQPPPPPVVTNSPPVATTASFTLEEDGSLTETLVGSDPDGDNITFQLVTDVGDGILVLNSDGSFEYTPSENYNGEDTFVFKVNDGARDSVSVVITLNVIAINDTPVAEDDFSFVAYHGDVISMPLENDYDVDGDVLTFLITELPTNGTAELVSGEITYTPNLGFVGDDVIAYEVSDGAGGTAQAKLDVSVRRLVGFLKGGKLLVRHPYSTEEAVQISHNVEENFSVFVRTFTPSANGKYIYYTITEEPDDIETVNLYRVEVLNPTNVIKISENVQPGDSLQFNGSNSIAFYPSPDDSKVAYTAYLSANGNNPEFYVANVENDQVQNIETVFPNIVVLGQFTKDSRYLFVRRVDRQTPDLQNLYRIDTQSSNSLRIVNSKPLTARTSSNRNKPQFELSEDGVSIFYRAFTRLDEIDVYKTSFTNFVTITPESAAASTITKTVSEFLLVPGSEEIVYLANHESDSIRKDIFKSTTDGSRLANRINSPLNYNLEGIKDLNSAISKDGSKVAYIVENIFDQDLYVRDIALVNNETQVSESASGDNEFEFFDPKFSKDSQSIYYLRNNSTDSPLLYRTHLSALGESELISDITDRPFSRVISHFEGDVGEVLFCGLQGFPSDGCRIYLKKDQGALRRVDSVEDIQDGIGDGFGEDIFKLIPGSLN